MNGVLCLVLGVVALAASSVPCTEAFGRIPAGHSYWIGTWATSPAGDPTVSPLAPQSSTEGSTIRYRIGISVGGSRLRLRFSNEYGAYALRIARVTVATADNGLSAASRSLTPVTFGGQSSITIPAGAPALSDPAALRTRSFSDLLVSVYVPQAVAGISCAKGAAQTGQAAVAADAKPAVKLLPNKCVATMRPLISEIDVEETRPYRVIVSLGDSITDGVVDPQTNERGWPATLARRLAGRGVSVVNAGIAGNCLLRSSPTYGVAALARFDRDVISVPGISHIILLEGINDIILGATANELIGGYSQIVTRAHEHGIKVVGATIMPFEGVGAEYYSDGKERVREIVNDWIRTSKLFDGLVDFDLAVRDSAQTKRLMKGYDSGDHIHPNTAGYRQMGRLIDLRLFN